MCTVTYLPQAGGYLFTSNRDEAPHRSSVGLHRQSMAGQQLLLPRDAKAGGTWIAVSDANRLVCILNGGRNKHHHAPPYRRSRGLMALDYFFLPTLADFAQQYALKGMEPFTMIAREPEQLAVLRWNGVTAEYESLDTKQACIWSSSTLYTPDMQAQRREWFRAWLEHQSGTYHQEAILDFHHHAGDGRPATNLIMNRAGLVRTVSITSVQRDETGFRVDYQDLMHQKQDEKYLPF